MHDIERHPDGFTFEHDGARSFVPNEVVRECARQLDEERPDRRVLHGEERP